MTPSPMSHADRVLAYESLKRSLGDKHQLTVAGHEDGIRAAYKEYTDRLKTEERDFVEEGERRFVASQKAAVDVLVPLLNKGWTKDASRDNIKAVMVAYEAQNATTVVATGRPLRDITLGLVFASIAITGKPERMAVYARLDVWSGSPLPNGNIVIASARAARAAIDGNLAEMREALWATEARVEAAGAFAPIQDSVEERWNNILFGGSPSAVAAEAERLDRLENVRLAEENGRKWNAADLAIKNRNRFGVINVTAPR